MAEHIRTLAKGTVYEAKTRASATPPEFCVTLTPRRDCPDSDFGSAARLGLAEAGPAEAGPQADGQEGTLLFAVVFPREVLYFPREVRLKIGSVVLGLKGNKEGVLFP